MFALEKNTSESYIDKLNQSITSEILENISEIQQPRSRFQIEKFVIDQHDTDEMKYVQCLIEIQSIILTVRRVALEIKKSELKIKKLLNSSDEMDNIDAEIELLNLEETKRLAVGTFRELSCLIDIYNTFNKKYTRAEIEDAQPNYWHLRLTRQAETDRMSSREGISQGNIESLLQAGLIKNDIEKYQE